MTASHNPVIYCIEIGGTKIRAGVFTNGAVSNVLTALTPAARSLDDDDPTPVMTIMKDLVNQLTMTCPPMDAVAISVTGMLRMQQKLGARNYGPLKDYELFLASPNVSGLKNLAMFDWIESAGWGVPVHIENDANAALRSATHIDTVLGINMGAGIAAALKRNGRIQHVDGYWSCYEIGHGFRWVFPPKLTRTCACGVTGCLEAAIGARALAARYGVRPENADSATYSAMRSDVITYLAPAIASTAKKFGFDHVLLSGRTALGMNDGFDFTAALQNQMDLDVPDHPVKKIEITEIPEIAGLQGAALALFDGGVLTSSV